MTIRKKILSMLAILFIGVLGVGALQQASAAGSNLVPNGDFEIASATASIPQGWTQDYWGTITTVYSYPVTGKTAGKAAKIQVTKRSSGDAKWMFTHIPVTAGTTYQYTDDYSANVATEVTIEYKKSNGTFSYVWLGTAPATGSAWGTFSASIKVPTGVVSMSVMHIIQSVGTLTLDNVSVTNGTTPAPTPVAKPTINSFVATPASIAQGSSTVLSWNVANASSTSIDQNVGAVTGSTKTVSPTQTTTYTLTATNPGGSVSTTTSVTVTVPPPPPGTGTNLVTNGTLEAGTTGAPTGWHADYWGSLTAKFTYPVAGYNSPRAAKINVTNWKSGDAKWWFDHVAVSDNQIYVYKENYLSNVVTNITVEFKMSDGTYRYQWVANAPVAGGTTGGTIEAQITVPKGAVSMTVFHSLTSNGAITIDNVSLTQLPSNPFPQGMVTIVMDDGLTSQFANARPILNTAGLKATYTIVTQGVRDTSGDTAAMTWANITSLKNESNEISAHSRTHPDLTALTTAQAQTEIKGSYDDLVAKGFAPKTFVYPLGAVNPAVEQIVKNTGFIGARGSYWGLNTPTADKYALYDMRLDKTSTLAQITSAVDQAIADKRWLILELHDILPSGGDDYAISTAFFQSVVTMLKQKGVSVVTLEQGMAYMQ